MRPACEWVRTLMQPDNPTASCCSEADRYEADDFTVEGGEVIAIINDGHGVITDGTCVRPALERQLASANGRPAIRPAMARFS
jgi:hypothetical protein